MFAIVLQVTADLGVASVCGVCSARAAARETSQIDNKKDPRKTSKKKLVEEEDLQT